MIVFLDTSILGLLANPNKKGEPTECEQWLFSLLLKGVFVITSDLCDYEVRRSFILETRRKQNINSVDSLDELQYLLTFLPLTDKVMKKAASIWAEARIKGTPTADDIILDADVIICAHYQLLEREYPGRYIVIATTNVRHLSRFSEAKKWREIRF
jgi:predicted nucleic acid-binding protein